MSRKVKKQKTVEELLEEALVPEEEQPYEVPGNWVWVKFGSVLSIASGKSLTKKQMDEDGIIPVYGGNGVTGFHSEWNVDSPTIVIGRVGFYCGSVHKTPSKAWITDNAFIVKYNSGIFDEHFLHWMLSYYDLKKYSSSSAQPVISGRTLNPSPLVLPPLNEQKRIADKVESLLNKVDEAKRLIDEAKETFELRRATLIKATLDEQANKNKTEESWKTIKIKELFNIFGGGTPSKSKDDYWNGDIPWISAKDMKKTYISGTQDYITKEGLENSSAKLAKKGSVVMVVRSGILQRTLPVGFLLTECAVNQDLKVFDSGDEIVNKYLMWYVKGNEKNLLHNYSKSGTTVNSIEFEKLKSHEIILPPMDVLKKKINKIENLVRKEESSMSILKSVTSIEDLKASILAKAFRGELGTNDPTEESAIELLKEVLQEQVK
ncbi:restriction endonuclease subunit S [Salipaludibacillus agaradhaerens]|uniref:restriction endonuclease subunit S n=1 Tax=Salipaludibacillus agaradhaerens TaxID=76935 RepID=UPI000997F2C7|nr:restriction endonuclease subunit S [Salipaludibacillus agaradhaerens]